MRNINKSYGILFVIICVFITSGLVNGGESKRLRSEKNNKILSYKRDEIIVKYKDKSSSDKAFQVKSGFTTLKTFKGSGIKRIKISDNMDVEQALEIYENDPDVEYAEPNYIYHAAGVPNDTHYDKQWALENTGQIVNNSTGTVDADIDATEAWEITTGSSDVVVAVIDSGVDYNHPDLSANIWINPGEIAGNGIDDDGNGKIDDIRGWDFVDSDNDPMDYNDHGTHVAGIIAAVGNNNIGIAGVAWSAKIMALRGLDTSGYGYTSDLIEAIDYASNNGADVINLSWGSEEYSQALKDVIDASPAIVVCAAGNDGQNNDYTPHYPSGYNSPNIISVAATDQYDNRASFSNYGAASVDIGAPGTNIFSTVPAKVTVWSDNFDDGNIDGWKTGGTNNSWGITTSYYFTPSYSIAVSPGQYYADNTDSWISSPSFDLTSSKGARLDFIINGVSESDYDILYVQASSNGSSWTDCETIDGSSGGNWINYVVDLKNFEGKSTVYIRFRFVSDESYNYEGFYIDNISVSASSTTFSGTEYQFFDGTSMAAPFVSSVAGLIKGMSPDLSASEIKTLVLNNVDSKSSLAGRVSSGGRLNTFNTLQSMIPCENEIFITLPEFVTEGDGTLVGSGIVSIGSAIDEDINILLSSNDTSEIIVPSSVTISIGQTSASFNITVIDDAILDGTQLATIIFNNPGCSQKTGQILVYDNETTTLTLEIPETAMEGDGVLRGSVITGAMVVDNLTVYLSSNNTSRVTVPASVIIYKGKNSAIFDLKIIDNEQNDGFEDIKINASAQGWNPASDTIYIGDNDNISWIHETYSTNLTCILRDNIRDRIYLADEGNKQLIVIDSQSHEIIIRLKLDSRFSDMAISKDNSTLAIVGGNIFLVNLESFEKRQLATDLDVVSTAFDHSGDLILLTSEEWGSIYHYDPDTEKIIKSFGAGLDLTQDIYKNSQVKTNSNGNFLYVAEKSFPGFFYKFDISGEDPVFLAEREPGYMPDYIISPLYDELYLAPAGIQIVESNTLDLLDTLQVEGIPRGVDTDLGGYYVFAASSGGLSQYNAAQREASYHYKLPKEVYNGEPQKRGIAIDRSSQKAFIINGDDYPSVMHFKVQVVELDVPFSLSLPETAFEYDGVLSGQGVVKVLHPPSEDMIISLKSDDTTEVLVPASVTIPAGQTSAVFNVTILDDELLDGTQSVSITSYIPDVFSTTEILYVYDNEIATITITIPETVSEGDGVLIGQGLITTTAPVDSDVKVRLISSDETEILVPYTVTIKADHNSATFSFTVNEDLLIDGVQTATITANVEGWISGSDTIEIEDNDKALTINLVPFVKEGDNVLLNAGYVSITDTINYDLIINLSSSDISEARVPETITIFAGETKSFFDLTIMEDVLIDGSQSLTITATAPNFNSDIFNLTVIDNENIFLTPIWPTYQGNSSHTGYIPVTLAPYFKERWVKELSNKALNPVTAADGRIFVTTSDPPMTVSGLRNSLFTLIADSGEIIWEKMYDYYYITFPPAYNKGGIYIQTFLNSTDVHVEAFDAATGQKIFKSDYGSQGCGYYAPAAYDDNIYIGGGYYGGAYAFNGETGEELWFIALSNYDQWTPAVNEEYVFAYLNVLSVINRQTGILEFTVSDPNFEWNGWTAGIAPVIGSENNIIVIQGGRLINFDLSARKIGWEIDANFSGQPSVANGSIYAISSGELSVRNESDGSLIWSLVPPEGSLTKNIIVTDSHIFTSTDDVTYVIDKVTKTMVWSYPAGGSLALSEGSLYIATDSGTLIAINVFDKIDSDNDGLSDEIEEISCTNLYDADSDDDGILDGVEDTNQNGVVDAGETDPCNPDTDGDGIQDGTELGYVAGHPTDTDTGIFQPDLDNSTTTDPLNADSDNDGIDDGEEDFNFNGRVDEGESNPDLFDNPLTNHPPVATAGTDQNVDEGVIVTLNGANSYDPDGNIDSYQWTQVGEPIVELSDPTAVNPTFTAPDVDSDGLSLTFKLEVTDILGLFSEDTCLVNISWLNEPPVADAGVTQTVDEGDNVILDGSNSSDVDDGIASYSWVQTAGASVILTGATSMNPSFTAPDVGTGGAALTFELTVTDNGGLKHTDTCIVNVSWVNAPPVAEAGIEETVTEGETVALNATDSSDPDDGIASYLWIQTSGVDITFSDPTATQPTFVTPPVAAEGTILTFKLTVTDNGGLKSEDTVSITVNDNGISTFPENVLTFSTSTNQDAGCKVAEGGNIVALDIIEPSIITNTQNRPENLIYGLINFSIKTDVTGGTVKVTIYLPSPAPTGYKWYKYSTANGWIDFSSNASFNATHDQVTLTLVDGGAGDDDRIANGIIIDPSGLGSAPVVPVTPDPPVNEGGGGGGGGSGIFGDISLSELTGYHFDWTSKDGTSVYMPVTSWIKALKGAQTHVESFAPDLAHFIRGRFDALERKAKSDQDGLLTKTGTYLFPVLGKIAEFYLYIVDSHELMDKAYEKTTIPVKEFDNLEKQGAAISSHNVKEEPNCLKVNPRLYRGDSAEFDIYGNK